MNRRDFVKDVCTYLRTNSITKPISVPKQVFHISDDEGNKKDFYVKKTDKDVMFTYEDVDEILGACLEVAKNALCKGDNVSFRGFGTLGLNYRKPRRTKQIGTDSSLVIDGRYLPKFVFGNDLRLCAKLYELSLDDHDEEPAPYIQEEDGDQRGD